MCVIIICWCETLIPLPPGIMQQFAISEATLFGWNSLDGESMGAGSNQGSVAHLSEVNQESITSRGRAAGNSHWTCTDALRLDFAG